MVFNHFQCRIEKHCVFIDFSIRKSRFFRINEKSIVYTTSCNFSKMTLKNKSFCKVSGFENHLKNKSVFNRIQVQNNWKTLCFFKFPREIIEKINLFFKFRSQKKTLEKNKMVFQWFSEAKTIEKQWFSVLAKFKKLNVFFNDLRSKTIEKQMVLQGFVAENIEKPMVFQCSEAKTIEKTMVFAIQT